MKYRAVLFDMDGTLMDTLSDLADSVNHCMRRNGLPEHDLRSVRSFVGNGLYTLIERAVPAGSPQSLVDRCFAHMVDYYRAHAMVKSKPYDGMVQLIEQLHVKGVATAVVTNKIQASAQDIAGRFFPLVDLVVADNGSRPLKPAPDQIRFALNHFACQPSQVIMIGDSEVDLLTAKNADVQSVAVLWGFRDKEQLIPFEPTFFAETVELLHKILLE